MPPQPWGVATRNGQQIYIHVLQSPQNPYILLPGLTENITSVEVMNTGKKLKWNKVPEGVFIYPEYPAQETIDHVVVLKLK